MQIKVNKYDNVEVGNDAQLMVQSTSALSRLHNGTLEPDGSRRKFILAGVAFGGGPGHAYPLNSGWHRLN